MEKPNFEKAQEYGRRYRERHPERVKNSAAKFRARNKEKLRMYHRDRNASQRAQLRDPILAQQNGLCAACRGSNSGCDRGWCVDHDHKTGKVRGVLCHSCNLALGHLKDDVERIRGLLAYMEKTNA